MIKKTLTSLSALSMTMLVSAMPLKANEFNDAQTKEIGQIVEGYLLKNPEILQKMIETLQAKEEQENAEKAKVAINENSSDLFKVTDSTPTAGNAEGSVSLVVFHDPYCGFCRKFHATLEEAKKEQKNLHIIYRDIAVLGEESNRVIRAALAASKQGKYTEFYEAVYKVQGVVDDEQLQEIAESLKLDLAQWKKDKDSEATNTQMSFNTELSKAIAVSGTPTFIIRSDKTKGVMIPGAISYAALAKMIEEAEKGDQS